MSFPVTDWQFWLVTVTAAGSLWALVKPFLPGRGSEGASGAGCSHCGAAANAPCSRDDGDDAPLVTLGGHRQGG